MAKPYKTRYELTEQDIDRFKSKIGQTDNCWIWNGNYFGAGRPAFCIKNKNELAHRVSYQIYKGDVNGLVLHTCDNKKCVNPDHLFLGTHRDNMQDMINKRRNVTTPGEKNGYSKLKNEEVIEIRKLRKEGYTLRKLGEMFNCRWENIRQICIGNTWKHLLENN